MSTGTATFDPFSDEYFDDPYDLYRRMRDEAPVFFSEEYGFWALFRYEDVCEAHKEWQTFSSSHGVDLSMLSRPPELIRQLQSMIMLDPPEHDRLRALVSRAFTPRAVSALEPMIREVITGVLDGCDPEGFDAVAEFSGPFPVEIISRMLGVPGPDRQQIRHWLDAMLHREPGEMDPTDEGVAAALETVAYFIDLVGEKRRRPGDDMISRLIAAEVDRGDGGDGVHPGGTRLTDDEIAGFASLLGGAGAETVTKLVGNAVVLFARNPGEWRKVLDDPGVIPAAVEEILRYWPPSQYQGRFSVREAIYSGVTVPPGFPTILVTGSASRDERFYDRPDDFDVGRPPSLALGFGYGIHSCLGAALARMESRIAIEELARRWPRYEVDEDGCRRVHMSNVAGYSRVPLRRMA
ncbi:MAG TPA: cytochrome P450 [Acidimicrobiales bacterium]|jgi:cytochrome P450|nr:cytochrome P450 [Acidimicrobiales bacterium]